MECDVITGMLYIHLWQKFENRALVMESEMKYWSQLTVDFMTDESDDGGDTNALVVHQLHWRSRSKCTIMLTYMSWCVYNSKMFL